MTKRPKPPPYVRNDKQAAAAIANVGKLERRIAQIKADGDNRIANIAARVAEQIAPLEEARKTSRERLEAYCTEHRQRLTRGKGKTARFETGTVSWRSRPAKVTFSDTVKNILARLKFFKLDQFIATRFEEQLDKNAMLKEPEVAGAVQGITIGSAGEEFEIKPFELDEAAS